jgi:hypothetical protein
LGAIAGQPGFDGAGAQWNVGGGGEHIPTHEAHTQIVASSYAHTAPSVLHTAACAGGEVPHSPAGGCTQAFCDAVHPDAAQAHSARHSGLTEVP